MRISIARDGHEIGTWSDEEVRLFYRMGRLVDSDFYWREGMAEWRPLRDLVKPGMPAGAVAELAPEVAPPPLPRLHASPKNPGRDWKAESIGCLRLFFGIAAALVALGVAKTFIFDDQELVMDIFYGAITGFVFGLIPLVIAHRKRLRGDWYFLICGGAGAVGGLILVIPVCIGLTVYVCVKQPPGDAKP